MRKIALYARCSTAEQHPDAQLHELRDYARRRGAEAIEYVDRAESGAKDRRPGLDQLVAAARRPPPPHRRHRLYEARPACPKRPPPHRARRRA